MIVFSILIRVRAQHATPEGFRNFSVLPVPCFDQTSRPLRPLGGGVDFQLKPLMFTTNVAYQNGARTVDTEIHSMTVGRSATRTLNRMSADQQIGPRNGCGALAESNLFRDFSVRML